MNISNNYDNKGSELGSLFTWSSHLGVSGFGLEYKNKLAKCVMFGFVTMHGSQTRKILRRDCDILQVIAFDALRPLSPYQIAESMV